MNCSDCTEWVGIVALVISISAFSIAIAGLCDAIQTHKRINRRLRERQNR